MEQDTSNNKIIIGVPLSCPICGKTVWVSGLTCVRLNYKKRERYLNCIARTNIAITNEDLAFCDFCGYVFSNENIANETDNTNIVKTYLKDNEYVSMNSKIGKYALLCAKRGNVKKSLHLFAYASDVDILCRLKFLDNINKEASLCDYIIAADCLRLCSHFDGVVSFCNELLNNMSSFPEISKLLEIQIRLAKNKDNSLQKLKTWNIDSDLIEKELMQANNKELRIALYDVFNFCYKEKK